MSARHAALDVFASRLGRIDVLEGGFARYVFLSIDGNEIEPAYVLPLSSVPEAMRKQVDATEWARESAVERLLHETH